ncbi:hypothetical protein ONZ45_g14864 [Pleurotus djamor]|nr:hypothetical protein ONZ45_g14864 [Pleurotus djamor]
MNKRHRGDSSGSLAATEQELLLTIKELSALIVSEKTKHPNEDPGSLALLGGYEEDDKAEEVAPPGKTVHFKAADPDNDFRLAEAKGVSVDGEAIRIDFDELRSTLRPPPTLLDEDENQSTPMPLAEAPQSTPTPTAEEKGQPRRVGQCRHSALDWYLPGDSPEVFRKPEPMDMPGRAAYLNARSKPSSLSVGVAKLLNRILGEVILTWPRQPSEVVEASLRLVNGFIFVHECVKPIYDKWLLVVQNGGRGTGDPRSANDLDYDQLGELISNNGDDLAGAAKARATHDQMLLKFLQLCKFVEAGGDSWKKYGFKAKVSPSLCEAIAFAAREKKEIQAYRQLGLEAYNNATWLRCQKAPAKELEKMKGKVIIESEEILRMGVQSGAFKEDECHMIDDSWTRICRPGPIGKTLEPIILWSPRTAKDFRPTEDKIFGAVLYGGDVRTNITSAYGQATVELAMNAMVNAIQSRENVKRHMITIGTLVKTSMGKTSTNGVSHDISIHVDAAGPQAREATRLKIQEQQSLRVEITRATPILQLRMFAYLEGFMPHYAERQMHVARTSGLVNRLGTPDTTAFASYGYAAAFHVDDDDTITEGWISGRSSNIQSDESNFAWADFKVLLELEQHTHWTWDAKHHHHGTSMNRLCAQKPNSWKTWAKHHPEDGQWSRANVITHATALAKKAGR